MDWLSKFIELGPLGVVCIALIFVVWKITDKYGKVIEANTKAMTEVATSNQVMKDSIEKQTEVLSKQGDMLTQVQNFLIQLCMKGVNEDGPIPVSVNQNIKTRRRVQR